RLPGGIARASTCSRMRAAWTAAWAGWSNATPFGGAVKPAKVGAAEWQGTHRVATIACALTGVVNTAWVVAPRRSANMVTAKMIAAAAMGHGEAAPLWRATKYTRMSAPAAEIATRAAQLHAWPKIHA